MNKSQLEAVPGSAPNDGQVKDARYSGRLELTWTNKRKRLLSHEDGSYEWVNPADYRVAEVRLLHEVRSVGEVGKVRAADNLLIRGDALNALTSLISLPEFAKHYLGKVKLVYIDPPFNTGQAFAHYDDNLEHSVWLTMIRDRLLQIRELLAPDGSVWLHLDDTEVHRARMVMDEVFGTDNFVATIIWERTDIPAMQAGISPRHDYLHIYQKSSAFVPLGFSSEETPAHYDKIDEKTGIRYCLRTLRMTGPGSSRSDRPTMWFSLTDPDGREVFPIRSDGTEGRWRWGPDRVAKESENIQWVHQKSGWEPYRRIYADAESMRPAETIWPYTVAGSNRVAKLEIRALFPGVTPFSTPKPEQLLERIIHIGSQPGDIVLDCFLGSGTTATVAHKMSRRWVGIELFPETVSNYAKPRLSMVVDGTDQGGVSKNYDWEGGGGFRVLEVAPSMYESADGMVYLADYLINGALAEATAAQLGFEYKSEPPFSGRKGRTRLAVIDGVVNEDVVRLIANALPERERVVVCGTGIDTQSREVLRALRPGSTMRKIPSALLDTYREQSVLRQMVANREAAAEGSAEESGEKPANV